MKNSKKLAAILLSSMIVTMSLSGVNAQENIKVVVDGNNVVFTDAKPYTDENSRTLVPLSFVAEALGAKVTWDSDSWKVIIEKDETKVVLLINSKRADFNGEIINIDTAPVLNNERTMVPLAFISQCFNAQVSWDETTQTVEIKQLEKQTEPLITDTDDKKEVQSEN